MKSNQEPALAGDVPPVADAERGGRFASLAVLRDYGILISTLALFVVLAVLSDVFLTSTNLLNILDQSAAIGIIACASTLVIIAGGFDLSVGAIYAIAGLVAAKIAVDGSVVLGLVAGLGVGLGLGLFNGGLVTLGRVNPFIATLSSSIMIRGLALAISGGFIVVVKDESFSNLGRGDFAGVAYSIWIFVAVALVCGFLLQRTAFGRYIYAVGGNAEAARLSGIRVNVVRVGTFAISGLSAGIAGLIVASRGSTGQGDVGVGLELSAIAAVVIGGTSIMGGEGAIWRTVLGVLLLALIGNGFNLLNVDPVYQQIFMGGIIVFAVAVDAWSRRGPGTA